jgi:RNA polymerase sigma-70 factor (ECF subfamily)
VELKSQLTDKARRDFMLVKAALDKGDRNAYAELMNNYRETLYFMMLKMTNSPDDADDLTIEAFGKAFRNLGQYTPDYAFSTWLFKIASNNCIDFLRKKRLSNVMSLNQVDNSDGSQEMAGQIPSESLNPEESFIRQQKIQAMRGIVDKLKPHYRRLVELRYFEERSYEEISEELDLPLGTVKAQLFRAREFLYDILKNVQEKL